jgi:hypothetical protein
MLLTESFPRGETKYELVPDQQIIVADSLGKVERIAI